MPSKPNVHTLSDGTTIRVKVERTIAGTYFFEVPSRKRKANSMMLLGTHMFCLFGEGREQKFIPVHHPDYSYASNDKEGAKKALAFFVDCAEGCIKEAEKEGIPVEKCYSLD